jgi:hypothetical protein
VSIFSPEKQWKNNPFPRKSISWENHSQRRRTGLKWFTEASSHLEDFFLNFQKNGQGDRVADKFTFRMCTCSADRITGRPQAAGIFKIESLASHVK